MANLNDIAKVAIDAYNGRVEKYSIGQSQELLRQAMIEANGGSTKLNYKNIRDGKCTGLFTLVEQVLAQTVMDGLRGDEYFNALVDYRNVALGDKNEFVVKDRIAFVVAEAAEGTMNIRRQRLGGQSTTSIPTSLRAVRIYDEMNRVLSGAVDFNDMITEVSNSFRRKNLDDIYALWSAATATEMGGAVYFPAAGSYDEDELLDVISHVEAAGNGPATIIGTKKGLRKLAPSIQGIDSQKDLYNLGYYGKFYGTPVVSAPQRHKVNSTEFVMDDDVLTIIAGDDRPIKYVDEGDPIMLMGDPTSKGDFTQEFLYAERRGMGIILAGGNAGIGRYEITG